ncbi:hypothetical protein [Tsukamurella sp. NPDC003166]|uniref:hypothetical protein n=1 Tax=Tsukamurella sp. NPDC003166 TaxID=3154444 RepID=UPI00339E70E9
MTHEPQRLSEEHSFDFFECGEETLDAWARTHALIDQQQGKSATHVWTDEGGVYVVAYFTLLPTVTRADDGWFAAIKPRRYQGRELPGVLLGKIALDSSLRGQGLGIDLLADAILTASDAMLLIGGIHVVIDPMPGRPGLRDWYRAAGFQEIDGTDRMYLTIRGRTR